MQFVLFVYEGNTDAQAAMRFHKPPNIKLRGGGGQRQTTIWANTLPNINYGG
jgi:hypothetical protein